MKPNYEELLGIVTHMPDYLVLVDHEIRYIWVNRLDPTLTWEDIQGRSVEEFLPPQEKKRIATAIRKCLENGTEEYYEALGYGQGQYETYYSCRVVPVPDDMNGNPRALIVTRDETNRRNAELKLAESEARFRKLVEASPSWIALLDENLNITYMNHTPADETGLSKDQVIGNFIGDTLSGHDREVRVDLIRQVAETQKPARYDSKSPDGLKQYSVDLVPIKEEILIITRDTSEQFREAQNRENMLKELDHRVKNTLGLVLAIANQTANRVEDLETFRQTFTGRIESMARAHESLAAAEWRGVHLQELFHRIAFPLVGPIKLNTEEKADPLLPSSSITPLSLVINELSTNAVKHGAASHPDGSFKITYRVKDKILTINWQELSPGIHEPDIQGNSFGLKLMQGLIEHDLGGSMHTSWGTETLCHEFSFSLSESPDHETENF